VVLGYSVLVNIHRNWIILLLGDIFAVVTPNTIPIREGIKCKLYGGQRIW